MKKGPLKGSNRHKLRVLSVKESQRVGRGQVAQLIMGLGVLAIAWKLWEGDFLAVAR